MHLRPPAAAAAFALLLACRPAPDQADPAMVSEWMNTLYGAIRVERIAPPGASRLLVYTTTPLYAGLAVTNPAMPPLDRVLNDFPGIERPSNPRDYDPTLIAVEAQRAVIDSLLLEALPTTRAALERLADSLDNARVEAGVDEDVRERSLELGRTIGDAIVAWSHTDGFAETRGRTYAAPVGPGLWVNDAPAPTYASQNMSGSTEFVAFDNPANLMRPGSASDRALILSRPKQPGLSSMAPVNMRGTSEPYWGELRPFALAAWNECRVPQPPPYSTDSGSPFYREALEVHAARRDLTPEQRTIALYWADNPGESGTPPGHWISIASQMVSHHRLDAAEAARLMVATAVAQADAFIASWGYKYQLSLIRPRTYIRAVIDSSWEPLIPTPPFPEYPSGHSTQSSAAAEALTAFIGDVPFEDSTSISIGHSVRRFDSFRGAAQEAGMSRIYAGIHFPVGNTSGRTVGQCIGEKVVDRFASAGTP